MHMSQEKIDSISRKELISNHSIAVDAALIRQK